MPFLTPIVLCFSVLLTRHLFVGKQRIKSNRFRQNIENLSSTCSWHGVSNCVLFSYNLMYAVCVKINNNKDKNINDITG